MTNNGMPHAEKPGSQIVAAATEPPETKRSTLDDLWTAIVEVHNEAKGLFLLGEELEPESFRAFLQPFNELRHAYEHVIRAKANETGLDQSPSDRGYQEKSLSRALGHEYRAFFDCADWIAVFLREAIQQRLAGYGATCINMALPDYYPKVKPRILDTSMGIAKVRGDKDISRKQDLEDEGVCKDASILNEVRTYKKLIEELVDIYVNTIKAVPALEECRVRLGKESRRKWIWAFVASLIVAALTFVATRVFPPASTTPAQSAPAKQTAR